MSKEANRTAQERKFESAKRATNKDRDEHETARDEKLARLKGQRLARDAAESGPKPKG